MSDKQTSSSLLNSKDSSEFAVNSGTDDLPTYQIHTFGCKVNTYDSSLLKKNIQAFKEVSTSKNEVGKSQSLEVKPNVHILNSCAVTHEATKQAGKLARSIKKKDQEAIVVLTGCAAQVDKKFFKDNENIDLIVGNSHKSEIQDLILKKLNREDLAKVHHNNIFKKEDTEFGAGLQASRTRAFLKIQDGCNSFCSFCVIPFARGKSRSIPIKDLVTKVNEFYAQGLREVILTGVHVGDYEDASLSSPDQTESTKKLEDLVESLLQNTSMPRFRLTSLEPIELSERLLESFKNPRMCPHFHMSIQSAQTRILHQMKRKYGAKEVEWSLNKIHEILPHAFVGMDVIVGFPGESQEEFQETYDRLASLPWTRIHVFPYSPRPMTRGMMMEGQMQRSEILERSKKLRHLSHKRWLEQAQKQVGQAKQVLILNKKSSGLDLEQSQVQNQSRNKNQNWVHALSKDYWDILLDENEVNEIPAEHLNEEVSVQVTQVLPKENAQGKLLAKVNSIYK